jgi:hypothetical protein
VRSAVVCRASNLRKDVTVSAVKGRNAKRLPRPLRKGLKHLRSIIFCIRENYNLMKWVIFEKHLLYKVKKGKFIVMFLSETK